MVAICSQTCSIVQDGWYTAGVSATKALATRPAMVTSSSPLIEHDSCASQPTAGAVSSGPIGGYAEVSIHSAIRVSAPGAMTLLFTPCAAPSSATTWDSPITPALAAL